MAAIFQGGHVGVERLPGVAHQRHAAGGGELARDATALQGRGIALPRQRFCPFRLTERFEQTNAAAVGIQAIDVTQNEWLVPVLVSLEVNTKGVALPPIQQTSSPSAWRTQRLLPTPGGPKIISRFRCPSAKARRYCSSSAKVATRTACGGKL
jgi:hypothetical protein